MVCVTMSHCEAAPIKDSNGKKFAFINNDQSYFSHLQDVLQNVKDEEIERFLLSVKGKFSNVLIHPEHIIRQELLGKGKHIFMLI